MSSLTFKINTYFALLTITVIGAGASLIIMHIANISASDPPFVNPALTAALHNKF
jgi:hypothetical protein